LPLGPVYDEPTRYHGRVSPRRTESGTPSSSYPHHDKAGHRRSNAAAHRRNEREAEPRRKTANSQPQDQNENDSQFDATADIINPAKAITPRIAVPSHPHRVPGHGGSVEQGSSAPGLGGHNCRSAPPPTPLACARHCGQGAASLTGQDRLVAGVRSRPAARPRQLSPRNRGAKSPVPAALRTRVRRPALAAPVTSDSFGPPTLAEEAHGSPAETCPVHSCRTVARHLGAGCPRPRPGKDVPHVERPEGHVDQRRRDADARIRRPSIPLGTPRWQ